MKKFTFIFLLLFLLGLKTVYAETFQSNEYTIKSGALPFQSSTSANEGSIRVAVSSSLIDFGPLSATNPIKRKITISVDPANSSLSVSENHPLREGNHEIPNTTCDQGTCTEKIGAQWTNPFTFGLGFSLDDLSYKQFPDKSEHKTPVEIFPGSFFVKLNPNQAEVLAGKDYRNIITFLAIPKL
jgi:hypothetical protein